MPPSVDHYGPKLCYDRVATVANAGTTSGAIDLQGTTLCGVFLPSTMEGTTLGFTACDTAGGTYLAVQDGEGADISLTVAASKYIPLDPSTFAGLRFIKLVVGSQTGAVDIVLATRAV